jgi:hypothetical protein
VTWTIGAQRPIRPGPSVAVTTDLVRRPAPIRVGTHPGEASGFYKWVTTTDHKVIGLSSMITSLALFFVAGASPW